MLNAKIERVSLTAPLSVSSRYHFRAGGNCDRGRVVDAVVGNYDQPVNIPLLLENRLEANVYHELFVIGGNQHGYSQTAIGPLRRGTGSNPGSRCDLDEQHCCRD